MAKGLRARPTVKGVPHLSVPFGHCKVVQFVIQWPNGTL